MNRCAGSGASRSMTAVMRSNISASQAASRAIRQAGSFGDASSTDRVVTQSVHDAHGRRQRCEPSARPTIVTAGHLTPAHGPAERAVPSRRVALFLVAAVVLAPLLVHAYVRIWPRR